MRTLSIMLMAIVFLLAGSAIGFQTGRNLGFKIGSEWAIVQAELLAREAGMFMPVQLHDDAFVVVMKQPRGLYRKAWQLSDQYDRMSGGNRTAKLKQVEGTNFRNVQQTTESPEKPGETVFNIAFSPSPNPLWQKL